MVRLMLVLGLVLSLAACGGSRTDGLSMSEEDTLEARLEAAEAERAEAEAGKAAAEADKAAAEADKAAAEADKAIAEAERDQAEADKAAAEADKVAAEADKAAAEADKAIAEADKVAAEADKAAAEADKAIAEADKVAAEADKVAAEADKVAAEADKAIAEADKDAAEADKAIAEAERDQAEAAQVAAEAAQVAAEAAQVAAEAAQVAAKAAQVAAEADKVAAEAAQDMAEAERGQAEADKVAAEAALVRAEAAKVIAEKEAQLQLREAAAARRDAADARREATAARQEAADARRELRIAQGQATAAQQEQARLRAEAEEADQQARQAESRLALLGFSRDSLTPSETTVAVVPKYNAPALVTPPDVTFTSPRGSSAGKWYATTLSNRGATNQDEMVVYSDVGRGVLTAIAEAHVGFTPISETRLLVITINNDDHKGLVTSTQFPRTASTKDFPADEVSMPDDDVMDQPDDMVRFSGYFAGGSGEFRCIGDACTVQYTGQNYLLEGGAWTFRTSENRKVTVPDKQYMYFGWWRRQTIDNGIDDGKFAYGQFRGTEGATPNGQGLSGLEGTAVYEGPAIGQYAIYAPLSPVSNHGSFNATARLTANFDDATKHGDISGSITGFDANPGWAVTLQNASIDNNGTIGGGTVSWMIDGNTEADGAWNGKFHADVDTYIDTYPDGVTGTFNATYTTVGKMIGAFGAHKK